MSDIGTTNLEGFWSTTCTTKSDARAVVYPHKETLYFGGNLSRYELTFYEGDKCHLKMKVATLNVTRNFVLTKSKTLTLKMGTEPQKVKYSNTIAPTITPSSQDGADVLNVNKVCGRTNWKPLVSQLVDDCTTFFNVDIDRERFQDRTDIVSLSSDKALMLGNFKELDSKGNPSSIDETKRFYNISSINVAKSSSK